MENRENVGKVQTEITKSIEIDSIIDNGTIHATYIQAT